MKAKTTETKIILTFCNPLNIIVKETYDTDHAIAEPKSLIARFKKSLDMSPLDSADTLRLNLIRFPTFMTDAQLQKCFAKVSLTVLHCHVIYEQQSKCFIVEPKRISHRGEESIL